MVKTLPTTPLKFIVYFILQQRYKFLFFLIAIVIWGTGDTIFPYLLKNLINKLQHFSGNRAQIYGVIKINLLLIILFFVLTEIFMRAQGMLQIYTMPKFKASMRMTVFNYVTNQSHNYFASNFSGNLSKKLADLSNSSEMLVEIICFNLFMAVVGTFWVLFTLSLIKPIFMEIVLVWLIIHWTIILGFLKYGNKLSEYHAESLSVLSGKIVDIFNNMFNVRLFSRRKFEYNYLKKYQKIEIKKAQKSLWCVELMRVLIGSNALILIFTLLFTLIHLWVKYQINFGDFTQVLMQLGWLLGWFWFLSYQMTVFAREMGTLDNALKLIRKKPKIVNIPRAQPIKITHGEIIFDHVNFSYLKKDHQKLIFKDLNIKINSGEKIGLVGFSGAGKSTFVNLILRFHDLNSGKILIDGQDIKTITQESLRENIAMIPQDAVLFHRTLFENIKYGNIHASDEAVIEASKLAHCHEFIINLKEQYQSKVGERGIKLSGGQRQRIAIARAILKNAKILMLDEATASLDSVTERLIQDSIYKLMENKTTIVIAHRLSTLNKMDKIYVFHQGEIIESGSQAELLSQPNSHFKKLWAMQTAGFLPDRE